jgi:hypothetical protein
MQPTLRPGEPRDAVPADIRARVTPAVVDKLTYWGVERFSVEALAERHHLDTALIYRYWGDLQSSAPARRCSTDRAIWVSTRPRRG